jgi:hypothetical protein
MTDGRNIPPSPISTSDLTKTHSLLRSVFASKDVPTNTNAETERGKQLLQHCRLLLAAFLFVLAFGPQNEGSKLLSNVDGLQPEYMALHPRRQYYPSSSS